MLDVKKPNKQTRHACVEVESWKKKKRRRKKKKKKHVEVCAWKIKRM